VDVNRLRGPRCTALLAGAPHPAAHDGLAELPVSDQEVISGVKTGAVLPAARDLALIDRKSAIGLLAGFLAFSLALSGQAMAKFTADEAGELDAEAKATLEKFVAEAKGAEEVFANAKGVLVCSKIGKAGAGVGAERGECVLTSGADERRYTRRAWFFRTARCLDRAREQGATMSNSKPYCEESQRGYRVRDRCIAAKNPCVTGIQREAPSTGAAQPDRGLARELA
jgi:hypothetical protein